MGWKRVLPALSLAAVFVSTLVQASASIVLQDGQVLEGTEVRREGDLVLLTLKSGNTLSLPAAVVAEVRQEPQSVAPSGLRYAEPEVLAGVPVEPPVPSEQLEVLGKRSRFQPGVVDPRWTPKSDLDLDPANNNFAPSTWAEGPIDPTWQPDSAFDARNDVLSGRRSTFQRRIVDPTWRPIDGFRKLEMSFVRPPGLSFLLAGPPRPRWTPATVAGTTISARPVAPSTVTPRCEDRLPLSPGGSSAAPRVARVEDPRFDVLPFAVYEAASGAADGAHRLLFTVAAGTCRYLGGDVESLTGAGVPRELASGLTTAALGAAFEVVPATNADPVALAFAATSLADPDFAGPDREELKLVRTAEELGALVEPGHPHCARASRKQARAARRAASAAFAPPTVDDGPAGAVTRFFTWSAAGGVLARHEVLLSADGRVAIDRKEIAAHLGPHLDEETSR